MGTVLRENIGLLNDKIIVKVEKNDYLPSFEKALKDYSKKANIPGFRKGMVPAGLIKKMYGNSVFTDEVLKSVEKELTDYMTKEKLDIFAQPLPLPENDARQINMGKPEEYSFAFEVGLKPEFTLPELDKLTPTRYKITVTDQMLNEEIERLQLRNGKMTEPETVTGDDNVLNISFTESDENGNPIEGGVHKENSVLVKYFNESFRKEWIGKKKDDSVVLQLSKAFDEKERDWITHDLGFAKDDIAAADKFFKVLITKIGLVEKSELNETFFKTVYPDKDITTEEAFRATVKEEIEQYWNNQSRSQLQHTLYHELLNHTKIDFPESFLKRWLLNGGEKPKTQEEVEQEFPSFTDQLKWTLILDKVARENNIEVAADDIKNFARQQLLGYMGAQAVDETQPWVADYISRMMQDRRFVEDAVHRIRTDKILAWTESQVKPVEKQIGSEEFTKMQEEHHHHH
ncbi:MAG: trigger factor [Bacteroidetes bacterium]|nr:trigger factor [Bacteroidota bacterium]